MVHYCGMAAVAAGLMVGILLLSRVPSGLTTGQLQCDGLMVGILLLSRVPSGLTIG